MAATTRILINIDHVATLRNARREVFPDPVAAAVQCEIGGADGIVFHLREDRRHINDDDVRRLREVVRSRLDFELSVSPEIVEYCCGIRPELATLVPERREEVTTEGGLDVPAGGERLHSAIARLLDAGIEEVALFVDPEPRQIHAAAEAGANAVELHTGDFALARTAEDVRRECVRLSEAGRAAREAGLGLHAGHGLDYLNFPTFRTALPDVDEVSIGFAIVARALFVGLEQAVRDMAALVKGPATR
jgi:pyridoxine 5-phosphate synthase